MTSAVAMLMACLALSGPRDVEWMPTDPDERKFVTVVFESVTEHAQRNFARLPVAKKNHRRQEMLSVGYGVCHHLKDKSAMKVAGHVRDVTNIGIPFTVVEQAVKNLCPWHVARLENPATTSDSPGGQG